MVYATEEDVTEALGAENVPLNVNRLIVKASLMLDGLLVGMLYTTDDDDMPSDAKVIECLRDCVIAQIEYWGEGGSSPYGASGQYSSVSIATVALTKSSSSGGTGVQINGVDVAPDVVTLLRVAGGFPVYPTYWG